MFDIGASELLLVVIVAIVVIGPKDLPLALRTAGKWIGKVRRVSGHFKAGVENMIREAELEEMEAKWRDQNAAIMAAGEPVALGDDGEPLPPPPLPDAARPGAASAEARMEPLTPAEAAPGTADKPQDLP